MAETGLNEYLLKVIGIDGADPQLVIKEASLFRPNWETGYVSTPDQCSMWIPLDESELKLQYAYNTLTDRYRLVN